MNRHEEWRDDGDGDNDELIRLTGDRHNFVQHVHQDVHHHHRHGVIHHGDFDGVLHRRRLGPFSPHFCERHLVGLLPDGVLRLLGRLRRRLLPDGAGLPDHLVPGNGLHDHHLQRRDDRRARQRGKRRHDHHRNVRRRVDALSYVRWRADGRVLSRWV